MKKPPQKSKKKPVKPAGKAKKPVVKPKVAARKAPKPLKPKAPKPDYRIHLGGPGAPTKYIPDFANQAKRLYATFLPTDLQLADFLGVSLRTITVWRMKHPAFAAACASGIDQQKQAVERGLLARAIGYTHEDEHISAFQGVVTRTPTLKHYPPDPGAAMNWLTNRDPDNWRNRQNVALGGDATTGEPVSVVIVPAKEA